MARNPDPGSSLPYLVRVPLGPEGIAVKVRDTWPRTAKVVLPSRRRMAGGARRDRAGPRAVVRTARRGDRPRPRPRAGEPLAVRVRPGPRTRGHLLAERPDGQAGPPQRRVPTARAAGQHLEILVDSHERYPWTFSHQQANTGALPAGDYAVEVGGSIVASVERKSLADLVATLTSGKLRYLLADLCRRSACGARGRGPLVVGVQARSGTTTWSSRRARRGPGQVPDRADPVLRDPSTRPGVDVSVPRCCGTPPRHARRGCRAGATAADAPRLAPREPTTAEVRRWALGAGLDVPSAVARPEIWAAYRAAT